MSIKKDLNKQKNKLIKEGISYFDIASNDLISKRRFICLNHTDGLFGGKPLNTKRCKFCGCFIMKKTMLKSQKCPLGKW